MIRAADDVRDAEVEVVGHRRELIGGAAVGSQQRQTVSRSDRRRPLRRTVSLRASATPSKAGALALADGPLVPGDAEPFEIGQDRLLPALDRPGGIGVVDPQDEGAAALVGEAPVGDRGEGVSQVQRPGQAGREPDTDAHASIGTCPRSEAIRSSHAPMAGYGPRSNPPSSATWV